MTFCIKRYVENQWHPPCNHTNEETEIPKKLNYLSKIKTETETWVLNWQVIFQIIWANSIIYSHFTSSIAINQALSIYKALY